MATAAQPNMFSDIIRGSRIETSTFERTKAAARANAWYMDLIKKNVKRDFTLKGRSAKTIKPGMMYTYIYDPKTKDTLPYYDTNPLIFPVDYAENGFFGINLHYLPPRLRAKLMDKLHSLATDHRYTEKTKLKISYQILKEASNLSLFKPCLKRYLFSHVRSPFIEIYSPEWEVAVLLPTQKFQKASAEKVWEDSTNKVNGRKK